MREKTSASFEDVKNKDENEQQHENLEALAEEWARDVAVMLLQQGKKALAEEWARDLAEYTSGDFSPEADEVPAFLRSVYPLEDD